MRAKSLVLEQLLFSPLVTPVDNDGTAITSAFIDRLGYDSAYVELQFAASSGTPTTALADIKLYTNSAASASSPTPVLLAQLETVLNIKTAGSKSWAVDLSAAKQYVYAVIDVTYADGTSPKNILAAGIVLGDKSTDPVAAQTIYGR